MEYYGFTLAEREADRSDNESYTHTIELAQLGEAGGFDGWFFAEHHGDGPLSLVPSPNLLVAIASRLTTTLRLGVLVTVLPYHHPLRAEEIRMLDQLSGGRLEIGFGRGAIRLEQHAYGVDRQTTGERFDAELEVVLRLLEQGGGSYESEWWSGSVDELVPAAVQRPYPPMWAAVVSGSSIERAGRLGANAATAILPLDLALDYRSRYHESWERQRPGQPVGKFSHGITLAVGETRKEAEAHARELLTVRSTKFLKKISDRPQGSDPAYADHERGWRDFVDASFDDLVERGFLIFGSVEDAVEQLERIVDTGIEMLSVVPQFLGLDYDFARRSLELFTNEVVPKADPSRVAPNAG